MTIRRRCFLSICSAMIFAHAAVPVQLSHKDIPQVLSMMAANLPPNQSQSLMAQPAAADRLVVQRDRQDEAGLRHQLLQQTYYGHPVFGGYALLHRPIIKALALNAQPLRQNINVSGKLIKGIQLPPCPFTAIDRQKTQQWVARHLDAKHIHQLSRWHIEPMVWLGKNNKPAWVYRVQLRARQDSGLLIAPDMAILPRNMHLIYELSGLQAIRSGPVVAPGGNLKTGRYYYGKDLPGFTLEQQLNCYLYKNDYITLFNAAHSEDDNPQSAPVKICSATPLRTIPDRYINGGFNPEDDVYFSISITRQLLKQVYGVELIDGKPVPVFLHAGNSLVNAFWNNNSHTVQIGDGNKEESYPLTSLDVIAHELGHGITGQYSGLVYMEQSGALNESFSDITGATISSLLNHPEPWKAGIEIIKRAPGFLRNMAEPHQDGQSIASAKEYPALAERARGNQSHIVHTASGVYNHFFYLLATSKRWSIDSAYRLMLYTNQNYWGPYEDFQSAGCALIEAAKQFPLLKARGLPISEVAFNLRRIGINTQACS